MTLNLSFEELKMVRQAILDRLVFLQSAKVEAENYENLLERLPEVCA